MNNKLKFASQVAFAIVVLLVSTSDFYAQNAFRKVMDFDGDGKTDYVVTRNENGSKVWHVWQSTAGYRVFQWGLANDQIAAGDYDGDGKTDFAVMRGNFGENNVLFQNFHIYSSANNSHIQKTASGSLGPVSVTPYPQDYDGDGKTDVASFHRNSFSGTIALVESSTNTAKMLALPANTKGERLGDLTGDGKSDFFYFNTSNYNVTITNYANRASQTFQFGATGDVFVPADFDGDGIGDVSVWRESDGTWWWLKSSDGTFQVASWGTAGDVPVPGDYDGDGKTDLAIWRRGTSQSYYWVFGSQSGVQVFPFGISTDAPVRY